MSTIAPPTGFRSTSPRRVSRGDGQSSHASDYTGLSKRIKAEGLLERRPGTYLARGLAVAAAFAGAFALLEAVGHSWWQVAVAVLFGALFAQAGFLAHDGAHRQIFASGKRNEWVSRVIANLVVGLGYGWWMHKHSRHHANPNTIGKDDDLDANAVVYTPDQAAGRTGIAGVIMRRQGWFLLPAMTLTGLDLHVKTIRMLFGRAPVPHRSAEIALLAVRLIGFPVVVVLAAGPVIGAVFLVVQLLVFGFLLGGAFAPNHIGMPLIDETQKVDYLRRQVLTSRDITGGWFIDFLMGGLNHQIEHHLFPSMPSANLRRTRRIVREYCLELGVPHTQMSLPRAMADVISTVHRLGLGHADPFDCPAAAALRLA